MENEQQYAGKRMRLMGGGHALNRDRQYHGRNAGESGMLPIQVAFCNTRCDLKRGVRDALDPGRYHALGPKRRTTCGYTTGSGSINALLQWHCFHIIGQGVKVYWPVFGGYLAVVV